MRGDIVPQAGGRLEPELSRRAGSPRSHAGASEEGTTGPGPGGGWRMHPVGWCLAPRKGLAGCAAVAVWLCSESDVEAALS